MIPLVSREPEFCSSFVTEGDPFKAVPVLSNTLMMVESQRSTVAAQIEQILLLGEALILVPAQKLEKVHPSRSTLLDQTLWLQKAQRWCSPLLRDGEDEQLLHPTGIHLSAPLGAGKPSPSHCFWGRWGMLIDSAKSSLWYKRSQKIKWRVQDSLRQQPADVFYSL